MGPKGRKCVFYQYKWAFFQSGWFFPKWKVTPTCRSDIGISRAPVIWNRRPWAPADVPAWRRQQEALEAHAAPVRRLREQMAGVSAGLAERVQVRRPGSRRWCSSFCGRSSLNQGGIGLWAALVSFYGTYVAAYSAGPAFLGGFQDMAVPLATEFALFAPSAAGCVSPGTKVGRA